MARITSTGATALALYCQLGLQFYEAEPPSHCGDRKEAATSEGSTGSQRQRHHQDHVCGYRASQHRMARMLERPDRDTEELRVTLEKNLAYFPGRGPTTDDRLCGPQPSLNITYHEEKMRKFLTLRSQ